MPDDKQRGITVHLSGPLSGCNESQKKAWRDELTHLLHEFTCTNPLPWGESFDFSRNLRAIAECDILVANMWKESIGTTFDIIHARNLGRPVVLIDPNHLENKLLEAFVSPEKPVPDLRKAAARVRQLAETFVSFDIQKKDGAFEPFDRKKLIRSVKLAVAEAGIADIEFPNQIIAPVIQALLDRTRAQVVPTDDIREQLFLQLDRLASRVSERAFTREAAAAIKEAWLRREARKAGDEALEVAQARIAELEGERTALLSRLNELQRVLAEKPVPPSEGSTVGSSWSGHSTPPAPPPASVAESLQRAASDFLDCMVVLQSAMDSAAASPFDDPVKAFKALELLGRCARERMSAILTNTQFVGPAQWFLDHRNEAPWLEYAAHESATTTGKFAGERTFVVDGKPMLMEQHLKIGAGGVRSTLRIYFAFDKDDRVVIGHCGRHLTNTKS